jgi:hypothetical protein
MRQAFRYRYYDWFGWNQRELSKLQSNCRGRTVKSLQPALYFFDLSGGNGVIAHNASFKIPNLARSEIQDSVSDFTDNLPVPIEQLHLLQLNRRTCGRSNLLSSL